MKTVVFAAVLLGVPPVAGAQITELSPDEPPVEPAAPAAEPAPAPQQGPVVIPIGPDGRVIEPEAPEDTGFYYRDDVFPEGDGGGLGGGPAQYIGAPVPETHVVRRGDTLWDITWFYFNNPFDWPKVWSYNPEISNPHWIYPGDQVRLFTEGALGAQEAPGPGGDLTQPDAGEPAAGGDRRPRGPVGPGEFSLRQLAFVDQAGLNFAAVVDGSTEEKLLLSTGDSIYLSYPSGRPPKVGRRYAIYRPRQDVKHPNTGKSVGAFVRVIGELEVVNVSKGKRARAIITDSTDVIERGHRVGPLKRQFKRIEPAPNKRDLQGTIVAQLFADELIGANQIVIIDRGAAQGVEVGNRMFVVRRGDAYEELGGAVNNTGQDDRRFPARAIGEILVVEADKNSALAQVTLSIQEIGVGDRVLMRKSK
jgi:hypothetical protein